MDFKPAIPKEEGRLYIAKLTTIKLQYKFYHTYIKLYQDIEADFIKVDQADVMYHH